MIPITRRRFLYSSTLAAATAFCPAWAKAYPAGAARNLVTGRKLRLAHIGVGGKGFVDLMGCAATGEDIVALCDVDFVRGERGFQEFPHAARFKDYREMLRQMGDRIDAVVISTPDHTHFPAALLAIQLGKHVYVQKPLTHSIGQARLLKAAALKTGVVTQMGNQGHANEGTRIVKEWIDAGVIGAVREIHTWTNRPIWPQGLPLPVTAEVPPHLAWNLWLGTARYRDFSPAFTPFHWRGWWDYGCGALGDMGCHLMDAPFWSLNLRGNVRVTAESEGGTEVSAPTSSVITYEFPARGSLPPLKYVWYDGTRVPTPPKELGVGKLGKGGSFYYGDTGTLMALGDYSESVRLVPESKMREFVNRPPKTIPRIPSADPYREWIAACKGTGPTPGSNIVDHSADLTEMVLLGNLALRLGRPINWDATLGVCTGLPEASALIHPPLRAF